MKRTIGLLAALAVGGCGVYESADRLSIESATLRYDAPTYGGRERHEVALVVLPGAVEQSACVRLECVADSGEMSGTDLCVKATERHEVAVGLYAHGRCVSASGVLTHEDGATEAFTVQMR